MNTPAGGVTLPEVKAAIEAVQAMDAAMNKVDSMIGRRGFDAAFAAAEKAQRIAASEAFALVRSLTRCRAALAGEWRDVRESLPDYEGANEVRQHLVYHPANFGPRIVTEHPSWWNRKDPRGRAFDGEKVSHWMPLPAAPLPKEPGR